MVFDYTAMGDARASDDLSRRVSGQVASFKERDRPDLPPGPTPVGFDKLQQMYDRTAVSFEGMQFVSRLGGAAASPFALRRQTCFTCRIFATPRSVPSLATLCLRSYM